MSTKIIAAPEFQAEAAEAMEACSANGITLQSITQFKVTATKVAFACRPEGARNHLDDRVVIITKKSLGGETS